MKYLQAIPGLSSGELTVKGTRIRVAQVISLLAGGYTLSELRDERYPHVSMHVLRGAVEEASQHLSADAHA